MTLGIPLNAWSVSPLIGDEIGVFNSQGELVGSSVFTNENIAIAIWGNADETGFNSAMNIDERFTIRVWNSLSDEEKTINVNSWYEGNDRYSVNGLSIIGKLSFVDESTLSYVLYQNIPNPFKDNTEIRFFLPKETNIIIDVYNIVGEKVAEIASGTYIQGAHKIEFNSSNLNQGSYFYKLRTADYSGTRSMIILR